MRELGRISRDCYWVVLDLQNLSYSVRGGSSIKQWNKVLIKTGASIENPELRY